jgi:hypothetical protein
MKKILLMLIILILTFLFLDRLLHYLKPSVYKYSKNLGWETKENYQRTFIETDKYGNEYTVNYETDNFGARILQSKNTEFSILVIGDSFTMDPHTSNSSSWFGIMKSKLENEMNKKISLFAIGGGGYGTNQQYLKTKKFLQKSNIKPDMVILQFCINDFMNNTYTWEKNTENFNQYLRRPYYFNDTHLFFHKSISSSIVRNKYFSYLKSPNYFLLIAGIMKRKYFNKDIDYKLKNDSIKITTHLIKKIRNLFITNNFYIFNCKEGFEYPENQWYEILDQTNIKIFKSPSMNMKKLEKTENIFFRDGGHYNELGNRFLGNFVYLEIKDLL